MVKEFWRSVRIRQSYGKKSSGTFFFRTRCTNLYTYRLCFPWMMEQRVNRMVFTIVWGRKRGGAKVIGMGTDVVETGWGWVEVLQGWGGDRDKHCGTVGDGDKLPSPCSSLVLISTQSNSHTSLSTCM